MTGPWLHEVVRDSGVPDLLEILSDRFSAAELDAVLWEVRRRRVGRLTATAVLTEYLGHDHARPGLVPAAGLTLLDALAFGVAAPRFEPLSLAPICPLGAVAVLAPVDPGAAWGAGGRCEVVSDCRVALALECAARRSGEVPEPAVRVCVSHRELHQPFSAPFRHQSHEQVFSCATAIDVAALPAVSEVAMLCEHLEVQLAVLAAAGAGGSSVGLVTVTLYENGAAGLGSAMAAELTARLADSQPGVQLVVERERRLGRGWYTPIGFTVSVEDRGELEHQVATGGFTDWTRRLLDRPGERLLVSSLATETLLRVCVADPLDATQGSGIDPPARRA